MEMADDTQTIRQFSNPVFREIYKNTWLNKISETDSKKKKSKLWVVFCIHDDTNAYLETYTDNRIAVLHKPDWFISLNNTQHISPTICPHDQEYEFVITLKNDVIRLAAPTWEQMLDWVESLRSKLYELKILNPKENLYSKLPETKDVQLLPTRDPTSPLPPPPSVPPVLLPGIETLNNTESPALTYPRHHPYLQRGISLPENSSTSEDTEFTDNITVEIESQSAPQPNVFNFDELCPLLENASINNTTPNEIQDGHYERLFQLTPSASPGPSNRHRNRTLQHNNHCEGNLLPPPQPYRTLREQQVLQLQKEIKHPGGVRLQLRRKDCISSIALADAMNAVWICGWKQKEHPMLYNALHIGDQLLSIEGISVKSAADANKILRSGCYSLYVSIVVKRVPFGQVYVIHRNTEGQSLGIVQEGNTAVIQTVQLDGLAARHGLTARAKTCDGLSFTNWVLTEINGRPLNLFFKENQVRDRLNSVGRDISILVQPLDLIKQLKKQLKSLRNYKEYILQ